MRKIILLGKNGQLGSEFIRQNDQFNFDLYAFGREDLDVTASSDLIHKTIADIRPDILINTTAFTNVSSCETLSDTAFSVNATSLKNLAVECDKFGIKFVTFSTDYVFDGNKGSGYVETDTPNPLQIYGLSKYAGELISNLYCRNAYIIRTNGVYGGLSGSRAKRGNFVLNILQKSKEKDEIEVVADQTVSPTYAPDLAKATYNLILNENINSGIYHLINEGHCSWAEFATSILDYVGSKTKIIPVQSKYMTTDFKRPLYTALLNTRARGYDIILPDWKDAIKRYLDSLK